MTGLGLLEGDRLVSLATGRGGMPEAGEWPLILMLVLVVGVVGGRLLMNFGLTRLEAAAVTVVAPFTVLLNAPLGHIGPGVALAANVAGCIIPLLVGLKILAQGRLAAIEALLLLGIATVLCFVSAEVVPGRGVLLHYRMPAVVIGVLAAAFYFRSPLRAGAAGYAAGALGVIIGADLFNIGALATAGNASRIILGGAGLLDGIYLVGILSAAIATGSAVMLRWLVDLKQPARSPA